MLKPLGRALAHGGEHPMCQPGDILDLDDEDDVQEWTEDDEKDE